MMIRPKKRLCVEKKQKSIDNIKKGKDFINCLDNDSLAKIFMMLPISERLFMEEVCPKWKEASELAWHDIKKYKCSISIRRAYDNRMLTQSDVKNILLRCGKYLKELSLSKLCDSKIIKTVGGQCKNLTRLEFVYNGKLKTINTSQYVRAFTQLEKLESIKIKTINMDTYEKYTILQTEIINRFPEELKELHLMFETCNDKLSFNLKRFKNLQCLTLHRCSINNIITELLNKTSLVYLDLQFISTIIEFIGLLFNRLVNLEHINILNFEYNIPTHKKIFPIKEISLFVKCKNLKYVNMDNFYDLYIYKFEIENLENLNNLVHLSINFFITNDSVMKIIKCCHNLKHLGIFLHQTINKNFLEKLTELKNLEYLKFFSTVDVRDEFIFGICNNLKKLKHLEMRGSFDAKLESIFDEISKLKYLEHLNLTHKITLSDSTIIAIANKCTNLKCLEITSAKKITETALIALTSLKNLQELRVDAIHDVTDNFIVKLKGLKKFSCSFCKKLTDVGVIQLIKNCPDLEYLDIKFNDKITINTIIAANEATKNRTNDIILHISTYDLELINDSKSIIESRWLTVHHHHYNNF